ncbi:hypothetical protein [Nostoc sp. LPT]|uniref:hypothetical protein n=1 Tax=Nostoc sp. LPT TaxID=2815387 RepID=UPI0025EC6DAC|nr:hypothetical protein [Nostoc sp. LPT]
MAQTPAVGDRKFSLAVDSLIAIAARIGDFDYRLAVSVDSLKLGQFAPRQHP